MPKRKKRSSEKKFLWITDPWQTLDHPGDTSLRLAEECLNQGLDTYWCDVKSIRWQQGSVLADVSHVEAVVSCRKDKDFEMSEPVPSEPREFFSIQYRPDPPVDLAYILPLQLLLLGTWGRKSSHITNPPASLVLANEKLEPSVLGDLMPSSLASCQWEVLSAFGHAEGRTVLKPLHDAQSHGVELLDWRSPSGLDQARRMLSQATQNFEKPVLLQKYLSEISAGEIRLWFLDGKLIAYVKRLPLPGDFRVNSDRGSAVIKTSLSPKEKKVVPKISKLLKNRKIRLSAVDMVEGFVTDFNFTSPGLIPQIESCLSINLAKPIVKALQRPV